jgi:hypothetical protein
MLDIVPVAAAWAVVDKSHPGWRMLEQHGERWRAVEALERLRGGGGEVIACDGADELEAMLAGNVATVGGRIAAVEDAELLGDLERVEADGLSRRTVLTAIARRRRALGG